MPERRCVVCRETGERGELLRFVFSPKSDSLVDPTSVSNMSAPNQSIVFDALRRMVGRGAYVHEKAICLTDPKGAGLLVYSLSKGSGQRSHPGQSEGTRRKFQQLSALGLLKTQLDESKRGLSKHSSLLVAEKRVWEIVCDLDRQLSELENVTSVKRKKFRL